MPHRDELGHAPGAAERGNDWLDGALAGWLLFIAIHASRYLWGLREGVSWPDALYAAAPVLAVAAVFPLLRFHRIGWFLALLALGLMVAHEALDLAAGARPRAAAAFLVVHLLGVAYLAWIIPEFWPRDAHTAESVPVETPTPVEPDGSADTAVDSVAEEPTSPAGPTPVTHALAAIHQRIVAAGSACAVTPVSVRAEAGRFGVTPAALRTEGLALYRTFLDHFLADGPLSPEEERELICLERALDLDDDGVWRLRGAAGLRGGLSPTLASGTAPLAAGDVPALESENVDTEADVDSGMDVDSGVDVDSGGDIDTGVDVDSGIDVDTGIVVDTGIDVDQDDAIPSIADALDTDSARAEPADAPHPSAQADIAPSQPRIHSLEPLPDEPIPAGFAQQAASGEIAPPDVPAEIIPPALLADYEERELGALLAWTGIPALPTDASRRAALDRLRALHRTRTEPLDACAADHPLEPGERCLAIRTVELYRMPSGTAPAPPLADVPGPVLDPRALVDGSLERDRDLATFQRAGACRFLLTERRLLLIAPSGQQSPLPVSRLRGVHPYRNGVEVQPQRGAPVFLAFTGGVDDVAMRIDRAAADLRASA